MIDLMAEFGKRYRVTMDESWQFEQNRVNEDKRWYYEIRGRNGHIYPQSETQIALELNPYVGRRFEREKPVPFTRYRDSSEGPTLLIDNAHVKDILRWVRPRLRRILTPEQKARLADQTRKYWFKKGSGLQKSGSGPVVESDQKAAD